MIEVAGMDYRADLTAGALKVAESRIIADLLLRNVDHEGWKDAIVKQNVLQAAAGGLARQTQMWPAGPITVRRPLGNRKVDVWRFGLNDPEPQAWRQFGLESGDIVIFAWHVEAL